LSKNDDCHCVVTTNDAVKVTGNNVCNLRKQTLSEKPIISPYRTDANSIISPALGR